METKCCGQLRDTRFCPSCGNWLANKTTTIGDFRGVVYATVTICDDDGDFSVFASDPRRWDEHRKESLRTWGVGVYVGIEKADGGELKLSVSALDESTDSPTKSVKLIEGMPLSFSDLRAKLDELNRQ